MYEGGEFYGSYQQRVANYAHLFAQTYQMIEGYQPQKGKLLELGCATGEFLLAGKERGWNVQGLDVSESLATAARKQHGLDIIVSPSIEQAALADASYEVVYASHVLEHLPAPSSALRDIHRILKPEGVLVLQVPNEFDDLLYLLFRWLATNRFKRAGADVVDHLYFFSPQSLQQMVGKAQFQILDVSTWKARNQRNLLRSRFPGGRFTKQLLFTFGNRIGRGPNLEVVARKR